MIKVDQYELIRTSSRVYNKSIHTIAKETGHSRATIRKVLKGEYKRYSERKKQPYPALGNYMKTINEWLQDDLNHHVKQRHTARRIYQRLKNECGYKGSERAVSNYVRKARAEIGLNKKEVFLILESDCGEEAEVDWGRAHAVINEKKQVIKFFCMRSRYSGKCFVRAYPCERQQAFFDAHIHAFNFFNGIFSTLVYDNLSSAVKKVLKGKKRLEQESFIRFHSYYSFTPRFCNVGKGHEKGGVEGLVKFARKNFMVPVPNIKNFEELNDNLLLSCIAYGNHVVNGKEKCVSELFDREKKHLLKLPSIPYENLQIADGKVDKYLTVLVDKNHYSVPCSYAGFKVKVQLRYDKIEIYHNTKQIAEHERVFGVNNWELKPQHFLKTLQRKPGAFGSCRVIRQWREKWPECLEKLLKRMEENYGKTGGVKEFISVLMLYHDNKEENVEAAVELAIENNVKSSEGVKHILFHMKGGKKCESLPNWPTTMEPDVKIYDKLGGDR
ncbi:transposase [Candidatus Magnetomorum sp. HK-1]|nr:transposase [Candidatus Magnetomorum sp. HK-1]